MNVSKHFERQQLAIVPDNGIMGQGCRQVAWGERDVRESEQKINTSLRFQDFKVSGKVEVSLKETDKEEEMLDQGVPTMAITK